MQDQIALRRPPELLYQNIPSHFYLKQSETQRSRQFKYQVLSGNNGALVRRVMQETRGYLWLEMTNNQQNHFHFRWAPTSRNINFDRLSHNFVQTVNHVEGHHEITTKNELFKNVKNYFDERNMNAFYAMPITFYVKVTTERAEGSLKKQLSAFKQVFNLLEEFKSLFDPEHATSTPETSKLGASKKQSQTDLCSAPDDSTPQRRKTMNHQSCPAPQMLHA